jgi:tetratricopeptide (TPR) repeat protein
MADFSSDGQRVFTASEDGTVRLWDARTGLPRSGPFKLKKGICCAQLSPDDHWLAISCSDWTLTVVEPVSAPPPAPSWLPELAETVAGNKLNSQRRFQSVPVSEVLGLKARLGETSAADSSLAWACWFLADPLLRPTSPSSLLSTEWTLGVRADSAFYDLPEHVNKLEEALQITPNDGRIHAQLARLIAQYDSTNGPSRLARVDWFSRRAIELLPEDPIAWWARAMYFDCLGDQEAALAAMERGSQFGSNNVYFWRAKGKLLEKAGRIDAAYDAFTEVIKVAEREWGPFPAYALFVQKRAEFLERHGRVAEAREDRLLSRGVIPRRSQTPAHLIDLGPVYNDGLAEVQAWEIRDLDLGAVPRGRQVMAGIEFDVRGLVQLASPFSAGRSPALPQRADGIPVRQPCHRLHFLHAADSTEADGVQIGSYVIHCADGKREEIPIIYGQDVVAWNLDPLRTNSRPVVAWGGHNRLHGPVHLFKSTWENPRSDVMIETIDFLSHNAKAAPFLVAITAEP